MGKLTNMQTLRTFSVGKSGREEQYAFDQLENLKALKNLRGLLKVEIFVSESMCCREGIKRSGEYLIGMQHLDHLGIAIEGGPGSDNIKFEEGLLEELKPHPCLKKFALKGYNGSRLPRWATEDNLSTSLPNLVELEILNCTRLQATGAGLMKLRHLKRLCLMNLPNVEYIEDNCNPEASSSLPSLEILQLFDLPKLKGWWSGSASLINDCRMMTSFPFGPRVSGLSSIGPTIRGDDTPSSPPPLYQASTDNVAEFKLLPRECWQLFSKKIEDPDDHKVESLSHVKELAVSLCSGSLKVVSCDRLKCLSGFLDIHLEELHLIKCSELFLSDRPREDDEDDEDISPWKAIAHNLCHLSIKNTSEMVNLPKGMQYLTSLQSLDLSICKRLESMPVWISKLTSLTRLTIEDCSRALVERCWISTGEDWPHIQHIPNISIKESSLATQHAPLSIVRTQKQFDDSQSFLRDLHWGNQLNHG